MDKSQYFAGVFSVLIAATLWGTTGTAAAFAPDVPSIAIGAVAMGGGGLLQALLASRQIYQNRTALRQFPYYLWCGAVAVAIYPLAFYGSMRLAGITVGTVVTIGTAPLLSALIEYFFDKQKLNLRLLSGAVLGILGMGLLSVSENHAQASENNLLLGLLFGLLAGLTYALYSWTARRLMLQNIPPKAAMGATFGLGALLLLPILFLYGAPLLASTQNFAVGLYMAFVPMFLGYLCFGYGLARISASVAITITLFEPVIAALLTVFIVGEMLTPLGWLGITLILACLLCISLPRKANKRSDFVENLQK